MSQYDKRDMYVMPRNNLMGGPKHINKNATNFSQTRVESNTNLLKRVLNRDGERNSSHVDLSAHRQAVKNKTGEKYGTNVANAYMKCLRNNNINCHRVANQTFKKSL
jgi:hypothetical protein